MDAFDFTHKKILITGATGFIGGAIARRLLADGHNVRVLARDPARAGDLAGAEIARGDLLDRESLRAGVAGCQIVIHCAGAINLFEDTAVYRQINAEGSNNICRAALEAGVERMVYTSSLLVHGVEPAREVSEEAPMKMCGDAYVDTKIEGEQIAREWLAKGLQVVIVRPGQVYGPRDWTWTYTPFNLIKRNLMTYADGGKGLIQPIFIEDLVDGYLAALEKGQVGEAYLLLNEKPVEIRQFFGFYAQMLGKKWIPSAPKPLAMMGAGLFEGLAKLTRKPPVFTRPQVLFTTLRVTYSGKKAVGQLSFMPKISLHEGMRQVEVWLREEGLLK
ncbi:MAG: NAD-dependent epimerase/dehydratase family protein [Anaerolineales bacterium]|nr:NAD-dependent epimerase/dehydratase family protein [Anaerolineales bacterium]